MSKLIQLKSDSGENLYPSTIIQKVTNNYGTYVKYADGTLIQYGQKSFPSQNFNVSYGGVYITSNAVYIDFPLNFIDTSYIDSLTFVPVGFQGGVGGACGAGLRKNDFSVYLWHAKIYTLSVTIGWQAIGRWK